MEEGASAGTASELRAWRPRVPGVREVLHARFTDHAYPLHTHDTWTLFIVDSGAIRYDLDRHHRGATPGTVGLLPPHVAHDGRTAGVDGYRKRVLYLDPEVIGEELIGAAVDRSALTGDELRAALSAVHDSIGCVDDALESETRLAFVTEHIRNELAGRASNVHRPASPPELADDLRSWLDERLTEHVTLADASAAMGATTTQLTRAFAGAFRIPPHRYVVGRRLDLARDRILAGEPLAEVAAAVGFFDQAHLTRRFKRFLGTTPGQFAGH